MDALSPPAAPAPSPPLIPVRLESISWTIDGNPVPMDWDEATVVANWGYESFTGRVPIARMPDGAGQGSIVRGFRGSGQILWAGAITSSLRVRQGLVSVEAEGPAATLARKSSRLPFQIRGAEVWGPRDAEPFIYANNNKDYDLYASSSILGAKINPVAYALNDRAGWLLWTQGWKAGRIAFLMHKDTDESNFDFEIRIAPALNGTEVQENTFTLGPANPDGTAKSSAITAANQGEQLGIYIHCNNAVTPAAKRSAFVTNIRANYLATDAGLAADWDTWFTSEVISVLAAQAGLDSAGVQTTSQNALPLDWSGPWPDLANYVATLDDWIWMVLANADGQGSMIYRPWGNNGLRSYICALERNAQESLEMLPIYNRITVAYESPPGTQQTYTLDAAIDPLNGRAGIVEWPDVIELNDPQPDNSLAAAVANVWLNRITQQRIRGPVDLVELRAARGVVAAYEILPGDLLTIQDFQPAVPAQRVQTVRYSPTKVTAELEDTTDPARLITQAAQEAKRSHRRPSIKR